MLSRKSKSNYSVDLAMISIFQEHKFQPHMLKFKKQKQETVKLAVKHQHNKQEVQEHTVIIRELPFLVIKKSKGLVLVLR